MPEATTPSEIKMLAEPDVSTENEYQRRYQQLAACHAKDATYQPDADPNHKARDEMDCRNVRQQFDVAEWVRDLQQHQASNAGEKDADDLNKSLGAESLDKPRAVIRAQYAAGGKPEDFRQV
jgi:hypothetical protein